MSYHIDCDACARELSEPGAVVFGPPDIDVCHKQHLCRDCWVQFQMWLSARRRIELAGGGNEQGAKP